MSAKHRHRGEDDGHTKILDDAYGQSEQREHSELGHHGDQYPMIALVTASTSDMARD
jgi:hypothetical protein